MIIWSIQKSFQVKHSVKNDLLLKIYLKAELIPWLQ